MHALKDKRQMHASMNLSKLTVNVKNTIYSSMADPLFLSLGVIRSFGEMYIESVFSREPYVFNTIIH